jgi:hypothetical protein
MGICPVQADAIARACDGPFKSPLNHHFPGNNHANVLTGVTEHLGPARCPRLQFQLGDVNSWQLPSQYLDYPQPTNNLK